MDEVTRIAKAEADRKVKIRIEVSGFPSQMAGSKFFEQIVKPEYKRLFEGSNLRVEHNGAIVFEEYICCSTSEEGPRWFVCSDTMHNCILLGPGCPV